MSVETEKFSPRQTLIDGLERVVWTFGQNLVIVLLATGSAGLYASQNWAKAFGVAGWAALVCVVTTALAAALQWHPAGQLAVLDRTLRTFLQTFLAVLALSTFTSVTQAGVGAALATAAGTALLAALKSLVGLANQNTLGDTTSVRAPHAGGKL